MKSWKRKQKKPKSQSHPIPYLKIVLGILVGFVLLGGIRFVMWVGEPYNLDESYSALGPIEWNGEQQLNLFIAPRTVVGIDPEFKRIQYFEVEKDEIESLPIVMRNETVLLDGYIISPTAFTEVGELKEYLYSILTNTTAKTNLSRWIIGRLWWRLDHEVTVSKTERSLPEKAIEEEGFTFSILNGAELPGLATESSSWVTNLGGYVLGVGNSTEVMETTYIVVYGKEAGYYTVRRLQDVFKGSTVQFFTDSEPQRYDIQIIVGKDFIQNL